MLSLPTQTFCFCLMGGGHRKDKSFILNVLFEEVPVEHPSGDDCMKCEYKNLQVSSKIWVGEAALRGHSG